jgi:hypothetical protein
MKLIMQRPHFRELLRVFFSPASTREEVHSAGDAALALVYGARRGVTLDEYRYEKFCQRVARASNAVSPQNLPPTSAAAKYHSMRVFCQVQQWLGNAINPKDWGWDEVDGRLVPLMTDAPIAPEALAKMIKCACKGDCSTSQCGCRRNGYECGPSCKHCRGQSCTNTNAPDLSTE